MTKTQPPKVTGFMTSIKIWGVYKFWHTCLKNVNIITLLLLHFTSIDIG